MSFTNGTFTLPSAAFVSGTVIQSSPMNDNFDDIETALTQLGSRTLNPTLSLSSLPASTLDTFNVYSAFSIVDTGIDASATGGMIGIGFSYTSTSTIQGDRIGLYSYYTNTAVSSSLDTAPIYTAMAAKATTAIGDGGTGVASSTAKGTFVGFRSDVTLSASTATNVLLAAGTQSAINVMHSIATLRSGFAHMAVTNLEISPGTFSQGYTLVAATTGTVYPNIGYGFSDVTGVRPVGSNTTLFGYEWATVSAVTVERGINLAGFSFSGLAFESPGFKVAATGRMTSLFVNTTETDQNLSSSTSNNNYPVTAGFVRLEFSLSTQITGFDVSTFTNTDGARLTVYLASAINVSIVNDATSTAANRILTMTGANVVLAGPACVEFIYSPTDTRWILTNTSP